jgi:hypothetical protein
VNEALKISWIVDLRSMLTAKANIVAAMAESPACNSVANLVCAIAIVFTFKWSPSRPPLAHTNRGEILAVAHVERRY